MVESPRIFTIPASVPFLPALIEALRAGELVPGFPVAGEPLSLARATLFLPTRRACRLARDLFREAFGDQAVILPRLVPVGDIDEDEIAFAEAATGGLGGVALDMPEALGGLPRRLLLARLILGWAKAPKVRSEDDVPLVANTPAAALALADDLARLMDDMTTRQVPWTRLDDLVPDDLDRYWQLTLDFLKIAREHWPGVLTMYNAIEPAARRDLLIAAEKARLQHLGGPVIAAGSTASMPATADLLAAIARLPQGAVVLPGLDTDLDADSWASIAGDDEAGVKPSVGHPQFAMQAFLRRAGVTRDGVTVLQPPAAHGRERILSEAMRPAAATDLWLAHQADPAWINNVATGMSGVSVIAAATAEEEALAIAVALRETLETPDKTAALITPDRALARRVAAQLARWQVPVDDSGGDALPDTVAGRFARLAASAAIEGLEPVTLLALLKHPLLRLGAPARTHTTAISVLERAVLRGPRPRPRSTGLAHALATFRSELDKLRRKESSEIHGSDPRARLRDSELDAATGLVHRLSQALAPLETCPSRGQPFQTYAARHREVVAALSDDGVEGPAAFAGDDGAALERVFDDIENTGKDIALAIDADDYRELFDAAVGDVVVRRHQVSDVRIRIFGPLEARLQTIDRVILGSMVESVWPPETRSDPWLSRPMRQELGLDLPERRISLSAHDFVQAMGAREVIITIPAKRAGAPTVASRFTQRLQAVSGPCWSEAVARGECYLAWARALDTPAEAPQPVPRPEPKPPLEARPMRLSVTEIENWLRDPYTIYARHVLRLFPLDAVDTPVGAADRGSLIHGAVEDFTRRFADKLPPNPLDELLAIGREHFAGLEDFPEAQTVWWPRFERIARWFVQWETGRREIIAKITPEIRGELEIKVSGEQVFKLTGRADRIEQKTGGDYAILDYKTGAIPTVKQVQIGLSPQMTLEAAMLQRGAFPGIPDGAELGELSYVSLKGGNPAGTLKEIQFKDTTISDQAAHAYTKLVELVTRFQDPQQGYASLAASMWASRYGDYDHLARVKEWATASDDENGSE